MRRFFSLGLLILVAFSLRIHRLGDQELRGDEGFTWNYIQKPPAEILATIVREGDPQPPLHYWLQWAWLQGTGDSEFAMRAWSALLSLLLVPLFYRLGRRFGGLKVGLVAAALTAVFPQQIWLAQDVRNMYQLATVFLVVGLLQLPREAGTWTLQVWAVYVICGILAMYSHYYALFVLAAQGAWFATACLRTAGGVRSFLLWAAAGLVIALCVTPWALIILPIFAQGQLADPGHLALGQYLISGLGDLFAGSTQPDWIKTVALLALPAVWIGGWLASRVSGGRSLRPGAVPLLVALFVLPVLGIYAVTAARSTFNTFYLSFAYIAVALATALALLSLWRRSRWLGLAAAIVLCLVFGSAIFNQYWDVSFTKTRGFREIAVYLSAHAQPGDIYLANAPDPAQVYYLRHVSIDFRMQPGRIGLTPAEIRSGLKPLLGRRIWFVPANSALDPHRYVAQELDRSAILAEDAVHYRTDLKLYLPLSAASPLDARFSGGIRLRGYFLAGDRLSLVWVSDEVPAGDYTIFIHLLAPDNFNLAGFDAPPQPPTSQWPAGTPVLDVHTIALPADRPITIVAGLYLPPNGERLKVLGPAFGEPDAVKVITLQP